jgi:DNA-binding NarL/FixJ family response regulator
MRILIVDDHPAFRHSLSEFLRTQAGIEVVGEAGDGLEAIRQTGLLHPDLVLMDVSMPTMSGYEATRVIKQNHPGTRVVMLSSHAGDVYRRAANDCQADGYIEKQSMKRPLVSFLESGPQASRLAV